MNEKIIETSKCFFYSHWMPFNSSMHTKELWTIFCSFNISINIGCIFYLWRNIFKRVAVLHKASFLFHVLVSMCKKNLHYSQYGSRAHSELKCQSLQWDLPWVVENNIPKKLFEAKRDNITRVYVKLYSSEQNVLYCLSKIIRNLTSKALGLADHVHCHKKIPWQKRKYYMSTYICFTPTKVLSSLTFY